jgi:2-(1,2-epoxy-1,2-dihydrophenyl)acetyl-CoA isomerase
MDPLTVTVTSGVAHLRLRRPDAANAIDLDTARAFTAAVSRTRETDVRSVLVTGDGARFCAGGDVRSMRAAADPSAYLHELATEFTNGLAQLVALEKPVVCAVQGVVAGAGLALMLSCDVTLAGSSTKFLMAYSTVGLTPDCGVSYLLPRAIGQTRALHFALTGATLTAECAERYGLIAAVVADEELATQAEATAASAASIRAGALGETKRLLRSAWERSRVDSALDEARTIARMVATPMASELLAKF